MDTKELPPNRQLLKAREKADWSVERVAFALNLPASTIEHLEQGHYQRLHGDAFILAYMRSYAELFSLDADGIIEQYREQRQRQQEGGADEELLAVTSSKAEHKRYRTGYGIAAALTLLASLSLLSPSSDKTSSHADAGQGLLIDTRAGTTHIKSLDGLPADNPTLAMVPDVDNHAASGGQSADKIQPSDKQTITLPSSSLHFEFSADCWVEVYDGDNKRIFAAMQKSDEILRLSGKPPFRITLGYAPGVELSYNGEPVSIDTGNADIAKLVLGNS